MTDGNASEKGITRRTFLKASAASVLAAHLGLGATQRACGASCECKDGGDIKLKSGIPLGGIGAGTVEIRDDGLFWEWQTFNNWRGGDNKVKIDEAFFSLYVKPENDVASCRVLATESRGGLIPVDHVHYSGEFPYAHLNYQWNDEPCRVELTAWSPFIPHDPKNSGLPVAVFEFEVTNTSDKPCQAAISASLKNMFGYDQIVGHPNNKIADGRGWQGITMHGEGLPEGCHSNGSMVLAAISNDSSVSASINAGTDDVAEALKQFAQSGEVEYSRSASGGYGTPVVGVISQKVTLSPYEKKTISFFITWHFPYFIDAENIDISTMYTNWFGSATDAADYLISHIKELRTQTRRFHDTYYGSNLPHWIIDAVNSQYTTMFKSAWWTKDNTFSIWEGLACCGSQTMDVAYYGSFPVIMLFPQLAKQAMRLSARFQNPSGRMPHFFPGTFQYPDAYHMIDLMPKYTLMVWRDYLWTGDRAYLDEMWPHVKAAMEHNRALDRNGDFVPDDIGIDQTYDGWEFEGASIYVGLINSVAQKTVAAMARIQGENDFADQYERLAALGLASLDKALWNGEFYDLFYDIATGKRDICCMTDQVNGAWYAKMLELGEMLPVERKKSALASIYKYNRGHDYIQNGTWRVGGPDHGGQWTAVWSGAEYMLASHMIYEGMIDEGIAVAKAVYDRHYKDGMIWNHCECGEHYYRSMSVLTVLMALQGFHFSAPEQRMVIDPKLQRDKHISPFVIPAGWGQITFREQPGTTSIVIDVASGEVLIKSLETGAVSLEHAVVTIGNDSVNAKVIHRGDKTAISFDREIAIRSGRSLSIELS